MPFNCSSSWLLLFYYFYVAFPCKEYIFMQAKVPAPGQNLLRYIACYSVDWLGNTPDLHLIEETSNNMKKKSGKPSEKAFD